MVVTASPDTYYHLLEYGMHKMRLRLDRLFLQAFMAGVYVGLAGHCCTTIAGAFSVQPEDPLAVPKAVQKLVYGMLFPVAFISIIWTGAELFTGNTMTMLVCILERRIKVYQLAINWSFSLVGNWLGALFVAFFLSHLTGALADPHVSFFLFKTAKDKTNYSFLSCFLRAVGCNAFVCLAVWFVIATDDGAGKIMALWFPILAFCVGGYEHIIANFYTLQVALMAGAPISVGAVVVNNFIPTLLGNLVGGCGLIGAVYWFNFYPTVAVREQFEGNCGAVPVESVSEGLSADANPEAAAAPGGGQSLLNGASLMVLPKESFGGHYMLPCGAPAAAAAAAAAAKSSRSTKQFAVRANSRGALSSRASQTRNPNDFEPEQAPNDAPQVAPAVDEPPNALDSFNVQRV